MTTNDYLEITGYSKEDWTILDEATSALYKERTGSVSAMYPINDKKFIKAIGKGYHLVSISWRDKNKDVEAVDTSINEASEEIKEAVKTIDAIIPSAVPPPPKQPTISGMVVPPPPKKEVVEEVVDDNPKVTDTEEDFFCEKACQTGTACDNQCQDCNDREHGPGEETEIQKIKDIVKESGAPTDKVIIASISKEDISWRKKRIAKLESLGLTLIGENYASGEGKGSYGIPIKSIDKSTEEEWNASIDKLEAHIKSLTPPQMDLQRKCSLLEKNCGMVIDPTNLKAIHLNTGVFVSFSALENMDDNAFNEFVPKTMDNIAEKVKAIKAMPKVDETIPTAPKPNTKTIRTNKRSERIKELGLKEEEFQWGNGTQAISKEWIKNLKDEEFEAQFTRLVNEIAISDSATTTIEDIAPVTESEKAIKANEDAIMEQVDSVKQETKKVAKPKVPTPKPTVKKETVKAKEEKYVPIASPKTVANFQFVDDLMGTLQAFKKSTYILAKIKEILASEEKDADKIGLISNAIQNI